MSKRIGALILALLSLTAVAVVVATTSAASTPTKVAVTPPATNSPGTLVVATELGYPPFRVASKGKYSGLELDLVQQIARNIGFNKVKFVNTGFDLMIPGIAAKKWDMIADQMFGWAPKSNAEIYKKVQDRTKLVSFSRPYYFPTYVLVTSNKHNPGLTSTSQLKEGMTVAAQKGGSEFFWAQKNLVPKGVKLAEKLSFAQSLPGLESGQIDGIIEEITIALQAQKTHKDLQINGKQKIGALSNAGAAFAFSPQAVALRAAVNAQLAKMIANGQLKALYTKYIPGFPLPALPASSFVHH